VAKQTGFIDEAGNPDQRKLLRTQLQTMVHYAESAGCRRRELLQYFGETFPEANCGACDNCLEPRDTWDGTLAAQKFLSCVWRAREASWRKDATFGVNHHAEVLTGADTERVRKWNHAQLSTYGIGSEHTRAEWTFIGRELVRLGLLQLGTGEFPTVEITTEGLDALKKRQPIPLTRLPDKKRAKEETARPRTRRSGEIECDEALFEKLRQLRREFADSLELPAYIVFGDVTLREMARDYPTDENQMRNVSGVGERKLEQFGAAFMDAIIKHLRENPRMRFEG
jgi:ATP-dependent DNA helicase RecQ